MLDDVRNRGILNGMVSFLFSCDRKWQVQGRRLETRLRTRVGYISQLVVTHWQLGATPRNGSRGRFASEAVSDNLLFLTIMTVEALKAYDKAN
jgi:hypothetical protein